MKDVESRNAASDVEKRAQEPPVTLGFTAPHKHVLFGNLIAHRDGNYALVVEVRSNGAPRFVRSGVHQLESYVARLRRSGEADANRRLVPMLVSPYLSPESRPICLDHDTAYLDLIGNVRLAVDTVYIERTVAERPVSETRALRWIFAPQAAAILRVLLREPGRAWRVADLTAQARASYSHVSNVRKALLARECIEAGDDGVVLVQPDALVRTWRINASAFSLILPSKD